MSNLSKNRICFVVPTYPPHFNFARELLNSYQTFLRDQADFYFVFTNELEQSLFGTAENAIILPLELRVFSYRGIINIKKFYALTVLQNQYDYIICLDSEARFIKHVDLLTLCETYFQEKKLLGSTALLDTKPFTNKCLSHFCETLDCSVLNQSLYLWFNNLPIYQSAMLPDFFEKTELLGNLKQLTYNDFDYYIFMYYLLFYQNFTVLDLEIEAPWSALETAKQNLTLKSDAYKQHSLYLCHPTAQTLFENPWLFLLVHLDREPITS